jgi:hypothetical protein
MGMNQERAALRGHIAVMERELRDLKLKAEGMRTLLRESVAAYRAVDELDDEKIRIYAGQLAETIQLIATAKTQLAMMESELNG